MKSKPAKPAGNPIVTTTPAEKLAMIRSGKKKKTVTGFKEKKNITFSTQEGKYVAIEKEKQVVEEGVTKKKRNFIMFESKLGTTRDRDLHKIGNIKNAKPRERVEERIVIKKKQKEYLDNYQYHETKYLKTAQPDLVIHKRWGGPVGGFLEEVKMEKTKVRQRGGSVDDKARNPLKPVIKQNKTSSILRSRPSSTGTGKKTIETTTKVGRRGSAGGKTTTTTKTEKRMSADSRGKRRISFQTSTTTTNSTRGRKK